MFATGKPGWVNLSIALVALIGAIALQQMRLNDPRSGSLDPQKAQQQEALQLEVLARSPTFGFDNLLADWLFLKWVQYFGDEPLREQTGYDLNDDYFDLITKLDPRFAEVYPFISTAVSFTQGKPETGIAFMERGTAALSPEMDPKAYMVWRYKGLDELLLLGDIEASIYSHEMAAQWVKATPEEDAAELAELYQRMAQFLRSDPDSTPVRFWAWNEVYHNAMTESVQLRAEEELLKLGAEKQITESGGVRFFLPEPSSGE
ncbi:hypothetical protein [Phormidium sp. CCY1219]|uniref:hypothetical protein n=1 Tax=Phormidium sp. CCY1219 TaxID=2886104 RepID=UPI002D1E6013|nr:hypothetical protein [Phormidium sp. CCY1219]MEB3825885.1 hypothetical protein [Phormidium sp. CCY1219]